jgi:hypothetical protein
MKLLWSLSLLLAGCSAPWTAPAGALLAANAAAIPVMHRDLFDAAWSAITGRDCSVVRLDRGESYCQPRESPPAPPPYCTRSLGLVDCWADPNRVPQLGSSVADGPSTLTPAQEANRTRRWPPL